MTKTEVEAKFEADLRALWWALPAAPCTCAICLPPEVQLPHVATRAKADEPAVSAAGAAPARRP